MRTFERQSALAAALTLAALAVPAFSPAAGQETQQEERPDQPQEQQVESQQAMENNLLVVAEGKSELSTFVRAVRQAGLASELRMKGPYTVFAPTNEAFRSHFDEQQLQRLLGEGAAAGGQAAGQEAGEEYDAGAQPTQQDRDELLRFVRGHIVPGEWTSDRLQGVQSLRDVLGQQIAVSGGTGDAGRQPTAAPGEEQPQEGEPTEDQPMDDPSAERQTMANPGQFTIGQASVVEMDVRADNGVLHVLDGVLTSEGTGQGGGGETREQEGEGRPQPEPQPEPQPQPAPDSASSGG